MLLYFRFPHHLTNLQPSRVVLFLTRVLDLKLWQFLVTIIKSPSILHHLPHKGLWVAGPRASSLALQSARSWGKCPQKALAPTLWRFLMEAIYGTRLLKLMKVGVLWLWIVPSTFAIHQTLLKRIYIVYSHFAEAVQLTQMNTSI